VKLRRYQKELVELSAGADNVLIQADTGSGKTPVLAQIAVNNRFVLCMAHRNILIKQLSKTLAKFNITHDVLATKHTVRQCLLEHRKLGLSDTLIKQSDKHVCSIDSLLSRHRRGLLMLDTQKAWVIIVDEAHHMIDKNKWGRLREIFPNSRIIGATATPCRLDQESLSSKKGGVFDRLIQAPELKTNSVTTLIEQGYLSDFKVYSIHSRIDVTQLKQGKHDFTFKSLDYTTGEVVYKMAGDAVKHYQRLANNKQALVFCVSIDIAQKTAEEFKRAGIACAAIHSKLGTVQAARIFDLFEHRVIKVLINVDMIGEGVDIPAIEALIMLRQTASFGLYRQWIGRSLRPEPNKPYAIIIDHVNNVRAHGLPDLHIDWSLENPPQASKSNLFPCPSCAFLIKAWIEFCPECGQKLLFDGTSQEQPDVDYIDLRLVEVERKKIELNKIQAANEKELRDNLQLLNVNEGALRHLDQSVHKIKRWFADVLLESKVSIYDLNAFFKAENSTDFWITNFTFADLNTNDTKCIKVYKKWLKSQ